MALHNFGFKFILVSLLIFGLFSVSFGQNYGLGISTHEIYKESSTSLNLSADKPICLEGNFELSFDVSLMPFGKAFFGYIVRIIEDDERNFDLLYSAQATETPFGIIVGDYQTKIKLSIAQDDFLNRWTRISIKFDATRDRLSVSDGYKTYIEDGLHLKKKGCYRLFFGTNSYKQFKTNDALPVKLRDIRIVQNNTTKYHWPLQEHTGEVAHERVNGHDGSIRNPFWMASMHYKWQKVREFVVKGAASTAFDNKRESLFVVGEDSLFVFNAVNSVLTATANQVKFKTNHGNQSIYSPLDDQVYNFLPDLKTLAKYSLNSQKWDKNFSHWQATDYWQANKVISTSDSSLYIFAGYGHLKYKNTVQRRSLHKNNWLEVKPKGDFFTPRYLSALGSNHKGDTIYILGGYGNASGSQMINPKNIYSMMRFTIKDETFKKLYDLQKPSEDFSFANSLVLDEKTKTYYGLVFPQHKYNSSLRLIVGSLTSNSYKFVGNAIPYPFNDIHSFADLFYCPESRKFVAVTLLRSQQDLTKVSIYTLQGPPLEFLKNPSIPKSPKWLMFMSAIFLFALLCGAMLLYLRRKKSGISGADNEVNLSHIIPTKATKNAIFLFGDLQIFDDEGKDITKLFTPLLKELFLLLLVNSVRNGRGLNSEKLDEILWPGKSEKSIRNNRSVNLTKLKSVLERIGYCLLLKEAGYWKIEVNYERGYIDYHDYLNLIKDKKELNEEKIRLLFELTNKGNLLSNHDYEWLDQYKSEVSNEIIDVFLLYANTSTPYNAELLIQMATYIFYFDPVNEEAMIIKCRALSSLGKHSLAKKAFDLFIKDYRSIYNEDFKKDFNQIVS